MFTTPLHVRMQEDLQGSCFTACPSLRVQSRVPRAIRLCARCFVSIPPLRQRDVCHDIDCACARNRPLCTALNATLFILFVVLNRLYSVSTVALQSGSGHLLIKSPAHAILLVSSDITHRDGFSTCGRGTFHHDGFGTMVDNHRQPSKSRGRTNMGQSHLASCSYD